MSMQIPEEHFNSYRISINNAGVLHRAKVMMDSNAVIE